MEIQSVVREWIVSCTRSRKVSRNTIVGGIVLLDKLRKKCPATKAELFSAGGELKGARSGLGNILTKYDLPSSFLKEATTRQVGNDVLRLAEALDFGRSLAAEADRRDAELVSGIEPLVVMARAWLSRQPLKISCDRQSSPASWIAEILLKARGKSGGAVEQHLVGAKLSARHPGIAVPNFPSHAGDAQTKRSGDFPLDRIAYHVTATEGREAIPRCKENLQTGIHPILLVPRANLERAQVYAEVEGIAGRVTILSMEDFITQNIIEMSIEKGQDFFSTLQAIIAEYNSRLEEVETDLSLRIEIQ